MCHAKWQVDKANITLFKLKVFQQNARGITLALWKEYWYSFRIKCFSMKWLVRHCIIISNHSGKNLGWCKHDTLFWFRVFILGVLRICQGVRSSMSPLLNMYVQKNNISSPIIKITPVLQLMILFCKKKFVINKGS